jgi:hypothetical protein
MKFESHITIDVTGQTGNWSKTLKLVAAYCRGCWSTSSITDDPELGPGNKFYFTSYNTDYIVALTNLDSTVAYLQRIGFKPVRKKIELIMFDEKI